MFSATRGARPLVQEKVVLASGHAWRRERYSDDLKWGLAAPKKNDKKNSILLCYESLGSHDRPEDYEQSPLDKLVGRFLASLVKCRERQQRAAAAHCAKREDAAENSWNEGLAPPESEVRGAPRPVHLRAASLHTQLVHTALHPNF